MPSIDSTVERELAAVDDALATGRVDAPLADERELRELALLLRADAPEPRAPFAAELGDRVRAGFPRRQARRLALPRAGDLRRPLAAVAALAALAVVIPLAITLSAGDDRSGGAGGLAAGGARQGTPHPQSARGLSGPGAPADLAPAPPQSFAPGRVRRVERAASLTLGVPKGELQRAADGVATITDRYGGYVLRSTVTSGEGGGGSFEVRIPQEDLRPALRDLSALGHVRSSTQSGNDVTRRFSSVADHLRKARSERRRLLARLEGASTEAEADAIRRRLRIVAAQIRALRGGLKELRLRTDYAAVSVSLVQERRQEGGGTAAAFDDFLDSLRGSAEIALRVLGVALPIGLLALAAWLASRVTRRRRREAALL
jgi:hypothetical protein